MQEIYRDDASAAPPPSQWMFAAQPPYYVSVHLVVAVVPGSTASACFGHRSLLSHPRYLSYPPPPS
jgi:hypothetical protein